MTVTAYWFGKSLEQAFSNNLDVSGCTLKMALISSCYVPAQSHDYWDDVSACEISGSGYSASGAELGAASVVYASATGIIEITAGSAVWTDATITARYGIIYIPTGSPANSPLLGYQDFGEDKSSAAGTFSVTPSASGWFRITATLP